MQHEEIFTHRLRHYMSQLVDVRGRNVPPDSLSRRCNLGDIATASILTVIAGERLYITTEKQYQPIKGTWKSGEIWQFIKDNRKFFKSFIPSFDDAIPSKQTVRLAICYYLDPEQFAELFIAWTDEVSKQIESIKPCNRETAMSGVNTKPRKVLIWAVHNWKEQNLEVRGIVREMILPASDIKPLGSVGWI